MEGGREAGRGRPVEGGEETREAGEVVGQEGSHPPSWNCYSGNTKMVDGLFISAIPPMRKTSEICTRR